MTAGTLPGTGMTIVINGPLSGRLITMATDGFMAGTNTSGVRATWRRADGTRQTSAVMIVKDSSGGIILSSRQ